MINQAGLQKHKKLDKIVAEIDKQLEEFEEGWEELKMIKFDLYEAYLNCYLDNGIYEIRYTLTKYYKGKATTLKPVKKAPT